MSLLLHEEKITKKGKILLEKALKAVEKGKRGTIVISRDPDGKLMYYVCGRKSRVVFMRLYYRKGVMTEKDFDGTLIARQKAKEDRCYYVLTDLRLREPPYYGSSKDHDDLRCIIITESRKKKKPITTILSFRKEGVCSIGRVEDFGMAKSLILLWETDFQKFGLIPEEHTPELSDHKKKKGQKSRPRYLSESTECDADEESGYGESLSFPF